MRERDVILTGIPRSGTTLACWLLNQVSDVVALVEPWIGGRFWLGRWNPEHACRSLRRFFEGVRRQVIRRRLAPTCHINGHIPTNTVEERRADRPRRPIARLGRVRIEKPLSPSFWLIVKHPAPFTALLDQLAHHFPTYAIVRHPLAVLASWNSVSLPVSEGRVPAAEWLDPSLRRALSRLQDRWDRQVYLLGWFFETYRRVLPSEAILRYEDIVASGGRALRAIVPEAAALNIPLANRNASPWYDAALMRVLAERLLRTDGSYWHFYSRESVELLIQEMRR